MRWTERLLVIGGAAALIWCAVVVADAVVAQRAARRALEAAVVVESAAVPHASAPEAPVSPHDSEVSSAGVPGGHPRVSRGSAIGAISIPRIDLSAVVLHGTDAQTLRRGPGHLEGTPLPGERGNAVIAGHRDSFFWPLRDIQPGDDIYIDTPDGQFHYRVTSIRVVHPRDVSVLDPTDEPVLTLITCYPFWVFGNAPDRLVVRAAAVFDSTAVASASHSAPPHRARDVAPPEPPRAGETAVADEETASDDEVLVRLAVERYRHAYNGRLIGRNEAVSDGLLRFDTCEIAVDGDQATAVCGSEGSPSSPPAQSARTFMLERAGGRWAIRSVIVD